MFGGPKSAKAAADHGDNSVVEVQHWATQSWTI